MDNRAQSTSTSGKKRGITKKLRAREETQRELGKGQREGEKGTEKPLGLQTVFLQGQGIYRYRRWRQDEPTTKLASFDLAFNDIEEPTPDTLDSAVHFLCQSKPRVAGSSTQRSIHVHVHVLHIDIDDYDLETFPFLLSCPHTQADLESYYDPMSQQRHTQEMVELTGSGSQDANLKKEPSHYSSPAIFRMEGNGLGWWFSVYAVLPHFIAQIDYCFLVIWLTCICLVGATSALCGIPISGTINRLTERFNTVRYYAGSYIEAVV
ncbi:MAG: hypothetical protein NXY57DRAFT_1040702 [Lentinula lateritia]|nr:MAG: hypothetical protein NXY57DRAFT_1040702 [Lentinula lateritia]